MKRLLFISAELPYPAHSGGKLKSLNLVKHFSKHYDVTLVCPLKLEDPEYLSEFLAAASLNAHECAPVARDRSLKSLAISYLKGIPLNVYRTESAQLRQRVAEIANDFDLIFLDHFEVAQYVPKNFSGRVIYHAHNTYHQMWQRFSEKEGFLPHRIAAAIEARRVRSYETGLCNNADLVFASPNDIESLKAAGAADANFRHTYHLGDDSRIHAPEMSFEQTDLSLVYVGYLGWEPNADGLLWFVEEVWPKLISAQPELSLNIIGKNADERLVQAVATQTNINLLGFVDDLEDVFAKSRVNIAPLHFGSGMKVKVLDAMARGLPTVTTQVGIEGVDAVHNTHAAIAETPDEMADSILQLLEDKVRWMRLSRESRHLIEKKYSWAALLKEKTQAIDALLASSTPPTESSNSTGPAALVSNV